MRRDGARLICHGDTRLRRGDIATLTGSSTRLPGAADRDIDYKALRIATSFPVCTQLISQAISERSSANHSTRPEPKGVHIGRHDSRYKLLFAHPYLVESLLRGFVPGEWIDRLDFDSLEPVSVPLKLAGNDGEDGT